MKGLVDLGGRGRAVANEDELDAVARLAIDGDDREGVVCAHGDASNLDGVVRLVGGGKLKGGGARSVLEEGRLEGVQSAPLL